ncbi:ATPase [Synergistales bacterium]|nr:ATPase [Synergistales bacterium]
MGKIEGISIQNYGSLKSVKLGRLFSDQEGAPLGNMVTIIGPSGAGKSTIADAFGFIADCLEKGVEESCDLGNRGGFDQLISQKSTDTINFELYYRETSNSKPITYELSIALDAKNRPYVQEERLRQRVKKYGRPKSFLHLHDGEGFAFEGNDGWEDETGEISGGGKKVEVRLSDKRKLGIATYGAMKEYTRIVDFMNFLKSWYLCYFSPDSARREQPSAPQPFLDRIGGNLNNVAQYMYREDSAGFKKILAEIQTKIPGIEKIEPTKTDDNRVVLRFWEKGFLAPFYSPRMSDGTLKLFAYYLLLHERTPRQLVLIEEPENGLYHQYLTDLATEMRKNVGTGFSKQLFITTHSPFFVNALSPGDVWVLEKGNDGFSTVKRASDYDYVKAMTDEDVPLGDLWYSKYFG